MIPVTKTFLPPQEEYQAILKKAWTKGWMTNRGDMVLELERKMKSRLGLDYFIAMTNGTMPLQIAIKALGLKGEIITTPFSYIATTSSIVWEGCKPVFVDIHPDYLTIDETKIENAITSNTSAILATHVYGNPCNVEVIQEIAKRNGLKVIFDAAHCFNVQYKGNSVFSYGDISTCSFHATKIFHTGEGGALIANNEVLNETCFHLHNFGHKGEEDFHGLGVNAKMSENQAAMGLALFPYVDEIISQRKKVVEWYNGCFKNCNLQFLKLREGTNWNYSYYPIIFETEKILIKVREELQKNNIFPRRYFYPALNSLAYVDYVECHFAESISKRILCLPLYVGLKGPEVEKISQIIKNCLS